MQKRKYVIVSLAFAITLLGSLAYGLVSSVSATATTQKGIQRIIILESISSSVVVRDIQYPPIEFYFNFNPEPTFINVSHVYINGIWRVDNTAQNYTIYYRFNNETIQKLLTGAYFRAINHDVAISNITVGMNTLEISRPDEWTHISLYRLELFIEYNYVPSEPSPPLGGSIISFSQLALLTPYINLALAVVAATAVTIAYVRHRKQFHKT